MRGGRRPGAGRKKGSKSPATLEREAALKAFRDYVIDRVKPLAESQMALARGVSFMFKIKETKTGGREHILITDPDEIGDILAQMDGVTSGSFNDEFYYVTTKAPDNKAIDSMLDRALGKSVQVLELPPDAETGIVVGFKFLRNEDHRAGNPADN